MSTATEALFVVVPVRGIATGKSRLAPVLDASARAALIEWLVTRTLRTLRDWRGSLDACVVVSASADAADVARVHGVAVVDEDESAGLNAAATLGARHAVGCGAVSVLILP